MLQYFLSLIVFVSVTGGILGTQHALEGSDMLKKAGLVTNVMITGVQGVLSAYL